MCASSEASGKSALRVHARGPKRYELDEFEPFLYEGGSICNENPIITPFTNALGFNAICHTKDQSVAVRMVHKSLFYLSKFDKLQTF